MIANAITITRTISSALKFATAIVTATATRKTTSIAMRGTAAGRSNPTDGVGAIGYPRGYGLQPAALIERKSARSSSEWRRKISTASR